MTTLSLLLVNWNTRDLLLVCLASIRLYPPSVPFEVIVVDNASRDGSAEAVRTEFPEVHLIESGRNAGYATGNNLAFAAGSGEFLLTLNPDTEMRSGTLDAALDALRRNPRFGATGVRQIGNDGQVQASVRGFPSVLGIFGDLSGLAARFPRSIWDTYRSTGFDYDSEGPAPQPMGTFLLFRRGSIPNPTAPFDEGFPIFFNEVDLLKRMAEAGWPAMYTPRAEIRHHGGESTRQVRPLAIWESHRSLVRYLRKHQSPLKNFLILPWLAPLLYASALFRARGYRAEFRS